jgi:hypothetical protein
MYQGIGQIVGPLAPGETCTSYDTDPSSPTYGDCTGASMLPSSSSPICSAAGCAADVANLLAGQQQILSGWGPQLQNWVSGNATILAISAAVFVGALLLIGGGGRRR